jgi:membrane-bound ClpP family serine protease
MYNLNRLRERLRKSNFKLIPQAVSFTVLNCIAIGIIFNLFWGGIHNIFVIGYQISIIALYLHDFIIYAIVQIISNYTDNHII